MVTADPRSWPRRADVEAELAADAVRVDRPPTPARLYLERGPGQPCPPWPVGAEVVLRVVGVVEAHEPRASEVRVRVRPLLVELADLLQSGEADPAEHAEALERWAAEAEGVEG